MSVPGDVGRVGRELRHTGQVTMGAVGVVAQTTGRLANVVETLSNRTRTGLKELVAPMEGLEFSEVDGMLLSGRRVYYDPREYTIVQIPLVDGRGRLVGVGFPSGQNEQTITRHAARMIFLGTSMPEGGIQRYFLGDLDAFPFAGIDTTASTQVPQFHAQTRPTPWAHNAAQKVGYCLFNTRGGLAQFTLRDGAGQTFNLVALPETAAHIIAQSPFLQHETIVLLGSYAGFGGDTSLASAVASAGEGGPTSTVHAVCGGTKLWPRLEGIWLGEPDEFWWDHPDLIRNFLTERVPAVTEVTVPVNTVQDALIIQKFGAIQSCPVRGGPSARRVSQ